MALTTIGETETKFAPLVWGSAGKKATIRGKPGTDSAFP
jgi:hypothetical protein